MDETAFVSDRATVLESFLKAHPDAERKLHEILDKPIDKIDASTKDNIIASLDDYFGEEITNILFGFAQPDVESHLQDYNKVIPAQVMSFLRKFVSLYAPKLTKLNLLEVSDQTGASALESFLKAHPDAEHQVREILDKRLSKIDASTWNSLVASLDNYWGKESSDIFFKVAQPDQARELEAISDFTPPEVINFLRKIISLYGPELADAFLYSSQLPNNWKVFYRDVYYDYVNKRSHIRVRLAKYNGEEPFVEGNADSILELTIFLIQTLLFLQARDFFGKDMTNQFIKEANKLIKFLQPPTSEVSDNQPDSKLTK